MQKRNQLTTSWNILSLPSVNQTVNQLLYLTAKASLGPVSSCLLEVFAMKLPAAKMFMLRCLQRKYLEWQSGTDDELWARKLKATNIFTLTSECETHQVPGRPAGLFSFDLRVRPGVCHVSVCRGKGGCWKNVMGTCGRRVEGERKGQKMLERASADQWKQIPELASSDYFSVMLIINCQGYIFRYSFPMVINSC